MRYLIFLLGLLVANVAQALDCEKVPDCESLGYSTKDDPNCADNGYMYCPFDQNYKVCVQYNCAALGFTEDDKTSWCKNIASCRGNEKYTLCVKAVCQIGDVFYSDGSCSLVEDYNPNDKNKIPVGVVFYVTDDGRHGKVVNLHNLTTNNNQQFDPQNPFNNTQDTLVWGLMNTDIPELSTDNYSLLVEMFHNGQQELFDGQYVTNILLKAVSQDENCQSGKYAPDTWGYNVYCRPTAAWVTHQFYPPSTNPDNPIVGQGKWYLPTLGEWGNIYGYDFSEVNKYYGTSGATGDIKPVIEQTLNALKQKGVVAEPFNDGVFWTSNEANKKWSWQFVMSNGYRDEDLGDRTALHHVRAVLPF